MLTRDEGFMKFINSVLFVALVIGLSYATIQMFQGLSIIKPTVYQMVLEANGGRTIAGDFNHEK
jgi:hypothetical protein